MRYLSMAFKLVRGGSLVVVGWLLWMWAAPADGVRTGHPWRMPWRVAGALASATGVRSPAGPPGAGPAPSPSAAAGEPRLSAHP
jgi:hypothetical protein